MTTERVDEVYSGLRYLCPSCKIPIRVGKHSITIDHERIKAEAFRELTNATKEVIDDAKVAGENNSGYRAIALPKIEKLRDALLSIILIEEELKQ